MICEGIPRSNLQVPNEERAKIVVVVFGFWEQDVDGGWRMEDGEWKKRIRKKKRKKKEIYYYTYIYILAN
jgi:hypothetical protein